MNTRLLAISLALLATSAAAADASLVELGARIYRQGILTDGSLLRAVGAGDNAVSGAAAACEQCHRRSGMGSREGELPISPITGPILFSKPVLSWPVRKGRRPTAVIPSRQEARAAYVDASLADAIRTGVDSSGRPLNSLMPRYALNDTDLQALLTYLHHLGATPDAGIAEKTLRLATILTPDADPARRQVVSTALSAWSTRGGISNLSLPIEVWQLQGEASAWETQLLEHYRRQPVFAVLSGAGGGNWQPVAEFCEQQALPCLFPIVDSTPDDATTYYNLYLDAGLPLEARLLARFLRDTSYRPARLIQLVDDAASEAAARLLNTELADQVGETRHWHPAAVAKLVADLNHNDLLVAWLRPAELQALFAHLPSGSSPVFVSARLAGPEKLTVPTALQARLRWLSTRIDPQRLQANNKVGLQPWAQHLQLPISDEALQAEVYAATYFFGDALARMRGHWSRDYLLETLESGMYNRPAGKLFYSLSLGPGQRVAAKAGHILGLLPSDYRTVVPLSPRLVP